MIEQALNRHGFETGNAQSLYFISAFPDYILQFKLLRGYNMPNFWNLQVNLKSLP